VPDDEKPDNGKQIVLVFTRQSALAWARFLVEAAQRLPEREERAKLQELADTLAELGMS
jgi:hypothetical protein